MKCELCNASMNQFEVDCFNDVCGDCHEKYTKENAEIKEDKEANEQ